jgi:poly(3-hydroxybutyrate) depolymerase
MPASPLGKFEWRGRRVDARAIRRTALFTVEGECDAICGIGQMLAAQELCSGLRPTDRRRPFGVFAGRRWSSYYPILRNVIYASD